MATKKLATRSIKNKPTSSCPNGMYWVQPYQRKTITKDGKTLIEQVKGYCCKYHGIYQKIAEAENIPIDRKSGRS